MTTRTTSLKRIPTEDIRRVLGDYEKGLFKNVWSEEMINVRKKEMARRDEEAYQKSMHALQSAKQALFQQVSDPTSFQLGRPRSVSTIGVTRLKTLRDQQAERELEYDTESPTVSDTEELLEDEKLEEEDPDLPNSVEEPPGYISREPGFFLGISRGPMTIRQLTQEPPQFSGIMNPQDDALNVTRTSLGVNLQLLGTLDRTIVQKLLLITSHFVYPVSMNNQVYNTQKNLLLPLLQSLQTQYNVNIQL